MKAILSLFLAIALLLVLPAGAQITTRTLDIGTNGSTGRYTSQAVVNGNPAIAYCADTKNNLMFARNSATDGSGTWTITTVDYAGDVGWFLSLAVVNGNPAISYYDVTNGDLKYVRALDANGTNWGTPVAVDSTGSTGRYTSLAVVNGIPAISYYDLTNADLKYVRALDANGTNWGTPVTVDSTGRVGKYTSLAVVNGNPAISYNDETQSLDSNLKYVRALDASGTNWGPPLTVDSAGRVGADTSLAAVNGNPAISYYDVTNGDLKYARALDTSGTSWGTPVTVDSTGSVGAYTSLAVVNGNPAISYRNGNSGDLKYVRALDASGTGWGTAIIVDSAGNTGFWTSLTVVNGNPAISYYEITNGDLKYVRALDASGTSWAGATTPDDAAQSGSVGTETSQAVVNGNPAICYLDASNQDLKYIRALDAAGTSWGTPVSVDSPGDMALYTSLAVINGNPAICYHDQISGDLKYVRALDASGTSWGTPVTVDGAGTVDGDRTVGTYTSLVVVNGNPAISYHDQTNDDLKYVRALDASGTNWGTPVTVDSIGSVGTYTSLAVVNGNPAISYNDETNFFDADLKYVRALDANGTNWGTPVTVASAGMVGQYTSLAVVNGNPAISYHDVTNRDLLYVRALDASGTSWDTPVTVDSIGIVGLYTSLKVVNGNPAISYHDQTNDDLKYVRALDASGTNWGTPVTVDSIGSVGTYTSLAVVNGSPAISYYDEENTSLKWATIGPYAEIVVTQASALTDGAGSVAFGTVTVGSSAQLTFTITNPGTAALTSLAVTKDGADNAAFTVSALSATTVPVGPGTATFTVTFSPGAGGTSNAGIHIASNVTGAKNPFDIALTGIGQTVFESWALAYSVPNDPDALGTNGIKNLLNFAFGVNPNTGSSGPLVYNGTLAGGGTITATGQPTTLFESIPTGVDFRALFVRRDDYVAAGLTYTVQFSPDLIDWTPSMVDPTVLADNGPHQIVSVPFPGFLSGKKARFFRVQVTISP